MSAETVDRQQLVFGNVEPKPLAGFEKFHCVRLVICPKQWVRVRVRMPGAALWYAVEERDGKWWPGILLKKIEVAVE